MVAYQTVAYLAATCSRDAHVATCCNRFVVILARKGRVRNNSISDRVGVALIHCILCHANNVKRGWGGPNLMCDEEVKRDSRKWNERSIFGWRHVVISNPYAQSKT